MAAGITDPSGWVGLSSVDNDVLSKAVMMMLTIELIVGTENVKVAYTYTAVDALTQCGNIESYHTI